MLRLVYAGGGSFLRRGFADCFVGIERFCGENPPGIKANAGIAGKRVQQIILLLSA